MRTGGGSFSPPCTLAAILRFAKDQGVAPLSMLTGVPLGILALPGFVSLVGAGIWLVRYFPRLHRRVAVLSLVLGLGMGVAVYALFLGPLLLP